MLSWTTCSYAPWPCGIFGASGQLICCHEYTHTAVAEPFCAMVDGEQGVDLAKSLELPEDGEEPWERAVDMAHHSVDWKEVSKQVQYVSIRWQICHVNSMLLYCDHSRVSATTAFSLVP